VQQTLPWGILSPAERVDALSAVSKIVWRLECVSGEVVRVMVGIIDIVEAVKPMIENKIMKVTFAAHQSGSFFPGGLQRETVDVILLTSER
jgi:hypothetical protein